MTADETMKVRPLNLQLNDAFSTHFCEWSFREDDILLHVFPRAGESDKWTEGRYIPKCRNCGTDMKLDVRARCPRCGKVGLRYVPGRLEDKPDVSFPDDMADRIKRAIDSIWIGNVAIEKVPELGAYVAQLQGASRSVSNEVFAVPLVDKFCEALDRLLELQ